MSSTTNLSLPYILPAQAQKHVTHNEALRALDAIIHLSVIDQDLTEPPQSPAEGDRHIIAASATGAWAGKENQIAAWQDGAWAFFAPQTGWVAWVADEDMLLAFDGMQWKPAQESASRIGINATADDTNRLALASPASLFSHEGNGHQVKVNKAAAGDTASFLFQTGFSGRAEIGTAGDDDFHLKVSADGTSWNEALVVDRNSGSVTFPNSTIGGGAGSSQELGGVWRSTRNPDIGWMTNSGASLSTVSDIDNATFIPLRVGTSGTYSKMTVYCQAGSAGADIRMALYNVAADGLLGTLEIDFGTMDCDSAGFKELVVTPFSLNAGIYYAVIQASSSSPTFRGGSVPVDSGAGITSSFLQPAGIGRMVYLDFATPWPADITGHTIGTGTNQLQLLGSYFCPNMMLR